MSGTGALIITGNSSAAFSSSELINGSLALSNSAVFSSNGTSSLSLLDLSTTNLAAFVANTTTISILSGGNASVTGLKFALFGSSLSTQNSKSALFDAGIDEMQGSTFLDSNISRLSIGNFSQITTIYSSTLTNTNVANFSLGDTANYTSTSVISVYGSAIRNSNVSFMSIGASGPSSVTSINSTSISSAEFSSLGVLKIFGGNSLDIVNSSITEQTTSQTSSKASIFVSGGGVNLNKSSIVASDGAAFGYSSLTSNSILSISSADNLNVSLSQLIAGRTQSFGAYGSSNLELNSLGNTSVIGSLLQSEASNSANISVYARNPVTVLHSLSFIGSTLETDSSPGYTTIGSNYATTLNSTRILTNGSSFALDTYTLFAYNSNLPIALTVGGSNIGVAQLYNTTTLGPIAVLKGGIFYSYGWLYTQVLSIPSSGSNATLPVSNSQVNVITPVGGTIVSTAITNSSGWTRIPLLLRVINSTMAANMSAYVVQASSGGLRSNQQYAAITNTQYLHLYLGPMPTVSNYTTAKLNYFTYPLQYGIGQPTTYLGIYTNAYPVQFVNNATWSEIDFQTVGTSGYDFVFTVIYPANLTTAPLSIRVDGIPIQNVQTVSNSTYKFDTFSISASSHKIALIYTAPNGQYLYQQYPNFNPGIDVILIVILLGVVGFAFMMSHMWRQQRKTIGPQTDNS